MAGLADRRDDEDGQPVRAGPSPDIIYSFDVRRELPDGPAGRALFLIQEREFRRVVVMLRSRAEVMGHPRRVAGAMRLHIVPVQMASSSPPKHPVTCGVIDA